MRTVLCAAPARRHADAARRNCDCSGPARRWQTGHSRRRLVGAPRGVIDSDKDGNAFVIGLVLTAKSLKALNAAEAPYLAMLKAY